MKPKGPCKGCGRTRLINLLGLCKRCNKDPTKFLSKKEIEQIRAEAEAAALAEKQAKEAEAAAAAEAEAAAAEAAEGEEGEEGEAPAEGEEAAEEGGDEAPKEED